MNTYVTLAGGCCVGLGGGMLWSGQGRMITDLSDDSTRGFCSGLFYSLMLGGSGLGGFIITFLFAPMEPGLDMNLSEFSIERIELTGWLVQFQSNFQKHLLGQEGEGVAGRHR